MLFYSFIIDNFKLPNYELFLNLLHRIQISRDQQKDNVGQVVNMQMHGVYKRNKIISLRIRIALFMFQIVFDSRIG